MTKNILQKKLSKGIFLILWGKEKEITFSVEFFSGPDSLLEIFHVQ